MKQYKPNEKTSAKIKAIEEAYAIEGRLTLRRIYYILITNNQINHSKSSYTNLSKTLTKLRETRFVNPEMIIDRHRDLIKRTTYSSFQKAFDTLCENYAKNSMLEQKKYVEVWIEKDTMQHIFLEDCYFRDVPLIVSKGFTSYSFKYEALERFRNQNKPVVILYFGDFDCEGEYIPKVLKRFFVSNGFEIEIKKVLLTENDIERLEGLGVEDGGFEKEEQLAKNYVQDFVKKYGKVKYEVEALPFNEVKKRFLEALHSEINVNIVKKTELNNQREVKNWIKNFKGVLK